MVNTTMLKPFSEKRLFYQSTIIVFSIIFLYLNWIVKHNIFGLQLASAGVEWCSRVHRHAGRGDDNDRYDSAGPAARQGVRLLYLLHTLRDPSRDDPGGLCVHHSLPRSQPVAQEHLPGESHRKSATLKRKVITDDYGFVWTVEPIMSDLYGTRPSLEHKKSQIIKGTIEPFY